MQGFRDKEALTLEDKTPPAGRGPRCFGGRILCRGEPVSGGLYSPSASSSTRATGSEEGGFWPVINWPSRRV
jgi:hypothetical protein